jgi:hypothetical protein
VLPLGKPRNPLSEQKNKLQSPADAKKKVAYSRMQQSTLEANVTETTALGA